MIAVKLHGRMGNQMFQYAFALSTAKKLNTRFVVLKPDVEVTVIHNYFLLNSNPLLFSLKLRLTKFLRFKNQKSFNNHQSAENISNSLSDSTLYTGFFQSYDYFRQVETFIKKHFTLRRSFSRIFKKKYAHLLTKKYVVIHTRKKDYHIHGTDELGGKDVTLKKSYYETCLSKISNLEDYQVIVISDDIKLTKKDFENYPNFKFESNEEVVDFQLMLHADILIISNSTFSWWGAYLNSKPNKKVYAPKYWLGFKVKKEYPKGVMSVNFDWVEP